MPIYHFPSVDCLFCDGGRHFEYDVSRELVVTYIHTPIFVQSLILLFVHILYFKPLINFLKMETWFSIIKLLIILSKSSVHKILL